MANLLTIIRALLSIPTAVAVLQGYYTIALGLTLLCALSDFLDGWIARFNGDKTNLGKLLDPFADKVFIMVTLVALVDVDRVSSLPVILLLIRELGVSLLRAFVASQGLLMEASHLGKVKTFLEFTSLVLILYGLTIGIYLLWFSVIFAYISAYEYIRAYINLSALTGKASGRD